MKLIGQIEKIFYEDEGFFVGVLGTGEKISGHYFESSVASIENAAVTLEGEYVEHPKYGRTFKFHTLNVNQHELFFFLNRVVKGFPKKVTAELIERFGEAGVIEILDNDIEKLTEFAGIKQKRLERIQGRWKQFRSMRELGSLLAPYDVTPSMLTTIAGAMKDVNDPVAAIKKNPYVLINVEGIGFRRADELALKMGVETGDDRRLACAMEYAIAQRCEREGNSCLGKAELFAELDTLLQEGAVSQRYEAVLAEHIAEESIRPLSGELLAPVRLYEAERFIFEEFRRRLKRRDEPLTGDLEAFLAETSFTPGAQQREALETLNGGTRLLCLVGYAGTGKSTTAKLLLDLLALRHGHEQVITCALSGIASQRIGEVSGYESATIQSLLVRFEGRDAMPYKVVLIDEASMINAPLFARLLSRCHRDAVIIIVGDDAQLPPIGAGDVLGDIIRFTLMPVVTLTKIYRQSETQAIPAIADAVRHSEIPALFGDYDDFRFLPVASRDFPDRETHAESLLAALAEEAVRAIPACREHLKQKELYAYLTAFQVISPMKGGTLGTENLNRVLQGYFNPSARQTVQRGDRRFALMDKVVHTKNDNMPAWSQEGYKAETPSEKHRIFNGMLGLLFRIDEEAEQVYVVYPLEEMVVCYDYTQLTSHLMLAYALTVHKVQGMEYRTVAMPLTFSHYAMLDRKLLYTAITRAKERCVIAGETDGFARALLRGETVSRRTVLQYLAAAE
ncbi:AAA family ATPase [Thiomicrolovo sp. ZZH C-3]